MGIANGKNWIELRESHLGTLKRSECPLCKWTCKCGKEFVGTWKDLRTNVQDHINYEECPVEKPKFPATCWCGYTVPRGQNVEKTMKTHLKRKWNQKSHTW